MNKAFVDSLIQNMKKADIVTKAAPWMVEGIAEKQMNVRYVGIRPFADWQDIIPVENNGTYPLSTSKKVFGFMLSSSQ